jgi:hypothetical protein
MYKTFTRKQIMSIAKCIRNANDCNDASKMNLIKELHKLFYEDNPLYAATKFKDIATGLLSDDSRTAFHHLF